MPESDIIRHALADLDGHLLEKAGRRALFDALCCMRAGRSVVRPPSLMEEGQVHIIGTGQRTSLLAAVASNADSAHAMDLDDVHWPSATHPGSVIWPVVLGVGDMIDASMDDAVHAAALGYQVIARTTSLLGRKHRSVFHTTATAGAAGAAATAAWLLTHDPDRCSDAVLTALSTAGGTRQALHERSDTTRWHRIAPAVSGVLAALTDHQVVVSAPVSGEYGLVRLTGDSLKPQAPPGSIAPVVTEASVRQHNTCGFSHSTVDGVLSLPIGDIDRVREIRVQVGEWLADAHGIDPPISARYARWHLATATALAAAGLTKQRFPWPLPTAVADLVARVTVTARPSAVGDLRSEGYAVVAGTRVFWSMEVPRGHAGDPFTDDGLTSRAVEMGAFDRTSSAARAFASVTGSSGTVRAVLAAAG